MSNKRDPSLLLHAFIVSFVSVMVYVKRVKRDEELRARIELEDSFLSENYQSNYQRVLCKMF